jgi:guanosine-3',5'-bis(diphosphate) 3'-pyrophosphohydrolase
MANGRFDISEYKKNMAKLLGKPGGSSQVFWDALDFAEKAHAGQMRRSGDPYILHPCQVARILVEELDIKNPEILAAALLHDTIEDVKEITIDKISELFGNNVATMVDGCTKIIHYSGDKQTFYKLVHRKIFSGAASRLEVMLIKLADRLHNLRTLSAMPRDRRQKVADETLDIYAPMAKIMGFYDMKRELYDLALQYKFPRQSHKLLSHIRQLESQPQIAEIMKRLREEFKKAWIDCTVSFGAKGLWGYFDPVNKVLKKRIDHPFLFVVEINDVHSCYRALGVVNQNFPPIPRTIRDFIANPKPTGYQGLHARANIKGQNYLFKIRTPEMARRARRGIIRGWSEHGKIPKAFERQLREMFDILASEDGLSARDMIAASGKKEIYTYTPKGDRICLPKQSIVLDFAYRVHTEIGNHCVAAIVGGQRVGPDHVLKDGDRVKIIRQNEPVLFDPHLQQQCQTPRARSGLARGFRFRQQELATKIGQTVVSQELKRFNIPDDILEKAEHGMVFRYFGLDSMDELYMHVGEGHINLLELAGEINNRYFDGNSSMEPLSDSLSRVELARLDPACIKFSACCKPVPTDDGLIGLLSDWGLSVHQGSCPRYQALKAQREDVVALSWKLKETKVNSPQELYVQEASRNRLLMLLAVAPQVMKVSEVITLSKTETKKPAWQIIFRVVNLHGLKEILKHFSKSGLEYEFVLEQ